MKMSSFEATALSMDRLRNIFSYVCLRVVGSGWKSAYGHFTGVVDGYAPIPRKFFQLCELELC